MRMFSVAKGLAFCALLGMAGSAWAADLYWVGKDAGKWSEPKNWSSMSGGHGRAGVPGGGDTAVFDKSASGEALVDVSSVGAVRVEPGYLGTITQQGSLSVKGDMSLAGGSVVGWTFLSDKPGELSVGGNLSVMPGCYLTCPRSSTDGEGKGRTVIVGGNLSVPGVITATGKGFTEGPGTPVLDMPKAKSEASSRDTDYGTAASDSLYGQPIPISPAGPGYGGRGAGIYRNPYGWDTVQPHYFYGQWPMGSGIWVFAGGSTYGSITAPMSLGSGAKSFKAPDYKYSAYTEDDTFWSGKGAYGGGAIRLIVAGALTIEGKIMADGALVGETGASGGSVYITANKISGNGVISANGSDAPGFAHSRGGGGGGRVAVVLANGTSTGKVRLQAYGGEGRWSTPAAAGTIYIETPKDAKGQGTLVVDNNGQPCRSMYNICTSISDTTPASYSFGSVVLRNSGVLFVGPDDSVTAASVSGDNGNVVVEGKFTAGKSANLVGKNTVRPQDEKTRALGANLEVLTFGKAYSMREELLTRSCQTSFYPYQEKVGAAADLSTYAYQDEVKGVRTASAQVVSKLGGRVLARMNLVFNGKQYAEDYVTIPDLADGDYEVRITLDNGMKAVPIEFKRETLPWERNTLGITDKVYYPFEPISVAGDSIKLSSGRVVRMNGFGLYDELKSEGRDLLTGPMTIKVETEQGIKDWKFGEGRFKSVKGNMAVYEAQADAGALKIRTVSKTEYDGCTRVEMDVLPGSAPETVKRMWVEIPMKDSEMSLFHATHMAGIRWNYAGKMPRGGKIVWEPPLAEWKDRRPPLWSVEPGTEGQDDGVVWDSTNMRCSINYTVNPFVAYFWMGGPGRGLAWFADSDNGWIPDMNKPGQVITREGDKLVLRVYLINKPSQVTEGRHIVFGLQSSPTKPMSKDFRTVDKFASWGYMTPAFGRFCCTKFPIDHDFSLVDKSIENRKIKAAGGTPDTTFLYDKVEEMKAKGWPEDMTPESWVARWAGVAEQGPMDSIYYEEHWTDPGQTDFDTYANEWTARQFLGAWPIREKNRVIYDSPYMKETGRSGNMIAGFYTDSLVDFSVYYGNEFMKRGISLYFDNTYPHLSLDPNKSEAHMTELGKIQPADGVWAQREYYQRIWNMMNYHNEHGMNPPLRFTLHSTNTTLLPIQEWATCNLDLEWVWKGKTDTSANWSGDMEYAPYPPDFLLAEVVGRQIGQQMHSHSELSGGKDPRANAGMGWVHEIMNRMDGPMSAMIRQFGYGSDDVEHVNYWADDLPFAVSNSDVKWLGMVRKSKPEVMILLQSYAKTPAETSVAMSGIKAWMDAETREVLPSGKDGATTVKLSANFGTRLLVGALTEAQLPPARPAKTTFFDDMQLGLGSGWKEVPGYVPGEWKTIETDPGNIAFRLKPSHQGTGVRVVDEALAGLSDYRVSLRFKLGELPKDKYSGWYGIFGLTYGEGAKPYELWVDADPTDGLETWGFDSGTSQFTSMATDLTFRKSQSTARAVLGVPDVAWHTLSVEVRGKRHIVKFDNTVVLDAEADSTKPALAIIGGQTLVQGRGGYVDIDDVQIVAL